MDNEKTIKWTTDEYNYKEKRKDWYVAFAVATISASATSFLLGNILFGIFILISAFTLAMHSAKKPIKIDVEINDAGILINSDFYQYESLKSFWIETNNKYPTLTIQSGSMFAPYISVPIGDTDIADIRSFLSTYVEEVIYIEPISQKIMEYLGF